VTSAVDPDRDPVVRRLRDEIARADLAILEAANERLRLVDELRRHKLTHGWEFVDRGREERLIAFLAGENSGPLSAEGVRELFRALLDLTKRELDRR
jgi:chorismate mutase